MDESEIDMLNRKAEAFRDYSKLAQNEVSTLSRWLTASLLAINGGGALAVANVAREVGGLRIAGFLFFGGLAMALFAGWFNQFLTQRSIPRTTQLASYYAEAAFVGQRNLEFETTVTAEVVKLGKQNWIGPAAGWLSFILCAAGAYEMADAIDTNRFEQVARCYGLERDLLSDSASHVESREMFTALGCGNR